MKLQMFQDRFPSSARDVLGEAHDMYVFINGELVRGDDAAVSIFDHGLLYADAVMEGIRVYGREVFRLDDHLSRLFESAKSLSIEVPLSKPEITEVIRRLIDLNELHDAHVRPIVTRGTGRLGLDPRHSPHPTMIIIAVPMPPLLGTEPIRIITSSIRRRLPDAVDCKIKSISYLNSVLARLQANAFGADDAILLDNNGFIAEATAENVFVVHRQCLFTPDTVAALRGITRGIIMEEAAKVGYGVVVRNLTMHDVYTADEVFLTGTSAEVVPVGEVDGRVIGDGNVGPVTEQMMKAYRALHGG